MPARVTLWPDKLRAEARRESLRGRKEIAANIAADAQATAPVLTGAYRDGIAVETNGLVVSVVDNDPDSWHKEYGTSDTPAHAALTNAAQAYGRYSGMRPRR
ncbi:HK97 gp10 family phage protein [Corynebacterium phoceense]